MLMKFAVVITLILFICSILNAACELAAPRIREDFLDATPYVAMADHRYEWLAARNLVKVKGSPDTIDFVDSNLGWIGSEDGLLKTSDAGKTWRKVNLKLFSNEKIVSISFIDGNVGAVAIQKRSASELPDYRLVKTVDSGATWDTPYLVQKAYLSLTNDGKSFLAWGSKYEQFAPVCYAPLLLSSSAGEKGWGEDRSLRDSVLMFRETGTGCLNQSIVGLTKNRAEDLRVLTSDRVVYGKLSDQKQWIRRSEYEIEDDQAETVGFGETGQGHIWFVETADSEEGVYARLVVDNGGGNVKKFEIPGYYLTGGVHTADGAFIVCGTRVFEELDRRTNKSVQSRIGVILQLDQNTQAIKEILTDRNDRFVGLTQNERSENIRVLSKKGTVVNLIQSPSSFNGN